MTRLEAKQNNHTTYYTGKSCKHGHVSERYTRTGNCVECNRVRSRVQSLARYHSDPETWKARASKWRLANAEKVAAGRKAWKLKNKDRVKAYTKQWSLAHPGYFSLKATERLSYVAQATPKWANRDEILKIYASRPVGYHVDHYYPLRGKFVCGLHTPANLQYLTSKANQQKSNKEPIE